MVKCFKLLIFFLFSLSMITCVNANNDFNSLDSAIRNNDVVTLTNDVVISDDEKNNYSDGIIINKNVVIDGNGYSIDARGITRIFKIRKGKMTIKNVALKNGRFNGDGGAISLSKTLPFNFCDVRLDVVNSTFVNNTASGSGGAISFVGRLPFLFFGGKLDVINSTFINNTASGSGGAISTNHIIIHNHVNYNRFVNNTAGIKGGSISNRFFDSIDNNWFGSNDIDDQIYGKQPVRYFIINTTGDGTNLFYNFRLNDTQDTNGYRFPSFNGEIYLNNVFNRTFDASMNNQCFNFNLHDNITIKVDNFEYNYTCIPYLSDVYVSSSGSDLNNGSKDSPVKEFNTAMDYVKDGGTVHVLDDLNLDKTVNILKNITIKSDDGLKTLNGNNMQIFNISPNFNVNISNLKLTNGFASYGGAVYSNKSNLNLSNCIFDSNNVEINGGAVFITGGVNYLNNCTFINNQAENEGGGIITDNMSTRC
ncbi:MAG: hypothetical protein LBR15_00850, partial [Methanobrevibacter sp.]|nr:hypothetical protein [Candidatus Methanovirga australis]